MKPIYVIDYDLPVDNGRKQFYRHLNRILRGCNWKRSSWSVIVVGDLSTALDILHLAKTYNARHANVYRAASFAMGGVL